MSRLDSQVAMRQLNINPAIKPIKQHQLWFRPEIMEAIEAKVKKLIDSGFVREEQHSDFVANIVLVAKKNRKIRIRIDFRDLNEAYLKEEFPLPTTVIIIDNTSGYERKSLMDGFSKYNQIKMFQDDEN